MPGTPGHCLLYGKPAGHHGRSIHNAELGIRYECDECGDRSGHWRRACARVARRGSEWDDHFYFIRVGLRRHDDEPGACDGQPRADNYEYASATAAPVRVGFYAVQ